ncbi:MAG: HDIG domain-containing protein [Clostridium sp.]|nr:HDIG domain-containing protein [Clostridium sp.]
MFTYRIKQFLWGVTAWFKPLDEEIINKYLNEDEKKIFLKLSLSEQQHSIRVCKDALKKNAELNVNRYKMAKIALLHDVGKINGKLNIIEKSVIVILDKLTRGRLRKYDYNKKIDIYYNHPQKSVKILKEINQYDKEFLEAIEKHHYKYKGNNIYLKIIKECDDNN